MSNDEHVYFLLISKLENLYIILGQVVGTQYFCLCGGFDQNLILLFFLVEKQLLICLRVIEV